MKNYNNQVEQYNEFNKELKNGIDQGLSLYNPSYDKTLYKDVKEIKKPKPDEEDEKLIKYIEDFKSPIMFGDLGSDLFNFFTKKKGDPFTSKSIEFYKQPAKELADEIITNYSYELYKVLGLVIIGLVIYKKI